MKLLVMVATLRDDPVKLIESLDRQGDVVTVIGIVCGSSEFAEMLRSRYARMTNIHVLYLKPDLSQLLGQRIAAALNFGFEHFDLDDYDYLLRIDADSVVPDGYILRNLPGDKQYVTGHTSGILIKMESFSKLLGGRYPVENCEDAILSLRLTLHGFENITTERIILLRVGGGGKDWRYWYQNGNLLYRIGAEPLHFAFGSLMRVLEERQPLRVFQILGCFVYMIKRVKKLEDVAPWVYTTWAHFNFSHIPMVLRKWTIVVSRRN